MTSVSRRHILFLCAIVGVTAAIFPQRAVAQRQPAASQSASAVWQADKNAKPEDYVGVETCSGCHQEQATQFSKTIHAKAFPEKQTAGVGCEGCHGPGKNHVDAIIAAAGDATKISEAKKLIYGFHGKPQANAERCLICHSTAQDQSLFHRSQHKLAGVSCEQCHSAHLVVPNTASPRAGLQLAQQAFFNVPKLPEESRWLRESLLRQKQPELCFGCHTTIQAQFALPNHHRVPEGLMKCTDCHSPHGTLNPVQLKKLNFEVCTSCHTEKRGPYVFEHPAARVEGCTACHGPHGTVENHLELRREGRFLCLQCHVDPAATNVPHSRLSFQTRGDCTRCHVVIHGSNVNEYFLQ
jgi:predicted CXXCH cytochrome family protein